MSCSYPIRIKNNRYGTYQNNFRLWSRKEGFYVPCGKCIGCRISKMEWLETACNYEYNKYGIGSFTTLTYDENNYAHLYNKEKNRFEPNFKDFQDFIKRLRQNLYRKYGIRHEFKYLVACEIGTENGRIHYHVLFFGLDYRNNDLDIYNAWNMGIVDNKPIMNGGIKYVLKYLTKDIVGFRDKYGIGKENHLFRYSIGLGKGFIDEHINEIIKNNGCYDRGDGKLRSLPSYWLNKLCIKPLTNYNDIRKKMFQEHIGKAKKWEEYSKTECLNYMKSQAQLKEKIKINKSRENGEPQEDFRTWESEQQWEYKELEL